MESKNCIHRKFKCDIGNAKYLLITDLQEKLFIEGTYDIGECYSEDSPILSFIFTTSSFGDNYQMDVYVFHVLGGCVIGISSSSCIHNRAEKKHFNNSFLTDNLSMYKLENSSRGKHTYIKTFTFSKTDINILKNNLFIPVSFGESEHFNSNCDIQTSIQMKHSMDNLLKNPIYSDFTIESAEGFKFSIHKAIVSVNSDVFKTMFNEDMIEGKNNYVKLIDVNKEDLESLLQFIYTGYVNNILEKDCRNLLMLADRYNLPGLSLLTQHALKSQINVNNAFEMLKLADFFHSEVLTNHTLKFISDNLEVFDTEGWKQLNDADLIKKVLGQFIPKKVT